MSTLDTLVAATEADPAWRGRDAFLARAEAMDALELHMVPSRDAALRGRAEALVAAMEALDRTLFDHLRERIRQGDGRAALAPWLGEPATPGQHYDAVDALLAGVLAIGEPDAPAGALPPDMVFYQPTPARHIVDGIRRAGIAERDVVLDLGSGLGHVPMLVHLLTGARARGVEREAAYVDSARRAAVSLGLEGVRLEEGDARHADLAGVDVFYLFTPFLGPILRAVVDRIQAEALSRPLRVVTLGPCTRTFARMPWLRSDAADPSATDRIVVFHASR
ncbi:MAG: class I SAM-dependent methyltransferase [Luteibacter sp.]